MTYMTYTFNMRPTRKLVILLALILMASVMVFATDSTKAELQRQAFISKAKEYIGVPYVTGGTDKSGFDCSGLVFSVGKEALGMDLPRTAAQMYDYVRIVSDSRKEAGDLLFFKTVGDKISHVGIYLGNDQFIHAASDGPNTGVIISSIHENYWSKTYFAVGQLLPSAIPQKTAEAVVEEEPVITEAVPEIIEEEEPDNTSPFRKFLSKFTLNVSAGLNWNFLTQNGFNVNIRGGTFDVCCIYPEAGLAPGLAVKIRTDSSLGIVQVPVVLSLSTSEHLRFYAGPVFTFGHPVFEGTSREIKASIFPGIIGFSWQSNSFDLFGLETRLVQDISFTIFNNMQGAALPPLDAFASGLCLTTGLRVTIPLF